MTIREMFDTRVKICKVCQGHVDKKMVIRDDYKGHLFYCVDCGTEYRIVGEGQSENELEVEYDNGYNYLETSKLVKDAEEKALALHRPLTISEGLTNILEKEER